MACRRACASADGPRRQRPPKVRQRAAHGSPGARHLYRLALRARRSAMALLPALTGS